MSRQWFPHYVGDYMRDTGHLTLIEDGAYRRLLDYYYTSGKPLSEDLKQLYRVCRAFDQEEQAAVKTVLAQFFKLKNGLYHNSRADIELKKAEILSETQRLNVEKRWNKKRYGGNTAVIPEGIPNEYQSDTSTSTSTSTSIITESLRSQCTGEHADLVFKIITCRPEFSKIKPDAVATEIHKAKGNHGWESNLEDFLADAANLLVCPRNPTGMLRAYLNRISKQPYAKKEVRGL